MPNYVIDTAHEKRIVRKSKGPRGEREPLEAADAEPPPALSGLWIVSSANPFKSIKYTKSFFRAWTTD